MRSATSRTAAHRPSSKASGRPLRSLTPIGLDVKLTVANQYAARGLPATFFINRRGTIVAVALGARDWDSKAVHAAIESLLE